jgi:hypothetical protein
VGGGEDSLVGFNFIAGDRDQVFLLPPYMREWLPADHLAWFVIDVVDQLDLSRFRAAYRADGMAGDTNELRKMQQTLAARLKTIGRRDNLIVTW